jgi:hypothetical protein
MIKEIEKAVECVRKAAREQSERIVSELNADFDARNGALAIYNETLGRVRAMREEADALERKAHDAFNSALTTSGSISLSLINQISQGQIVTSAETPTPRKLKVQEAAE